MYLLKGTDNFNHISVYRIYIMITFKSSNKFLKKMYFHIQSRSRNLTFHKTCVCLVIIDKLARM